MNVCFGLGTSSLTGPEITQWARMPGQECPGILLSLLPYVGGCWFLFLTEPSFQPQQLFKTHSLEPVITVSFHAWSVQSPAFWSVLANLVVCSLYLLWPPKVALPVASLCKPSLPQYPSASPRGAQRLTLEIKLASMEVAQNV